MLYNRGWSVFISEILKWDTMWIYDSDFHNLESDKRLTGKINTKKVFIDKNVFIGSNVKILKGVYIGKNSVIANGSIVTKSIPANVIAGGVPAKIIKNTQVSKENNIWFHFWI